LIDLRYHIISIVAVFLALALGILLGSSVVSGPLEARLQDDLRRARDARQSAERQRDEVASRSDALTERLSGEAGTWAVQDRLADRGVLLVGDASELPDWTDEVMTPLTNAGVTEAGRLLFTERWALEDDTDGDDLVDAVQTTLGEFDGGDDPASNAARVLGENVLTAQGREMLNALADADFLNIQIADDAAWPPPNAVVVALSAARDEDAEPSPWIAEYVRAAAADAPTLAATNGSSGTSLVSELRDIDDLPASLATFDSAGEEIDPGGIGVVAALVAAADGRGGHYGTAQGRSFVPAVTPED
jgi:hypothetical protein